MCPTFGQGPRGESREGGGVEDDVVDVSGERRAGVCGEGSLQACLNDKGTTPLQVFRIYSTGNNVYTVEL